MRSGHFLLLFITVMLMGSFRVHADPDPGLEFRENKGQWDPAILYRAELNNGYVFITRHGLEYIFFKHPDFKNFHSAGSGSENESARNLPGRTDPKNEIPVHIHSFSLGFPGSSESVGVTAQGKSETYYNYFLGKDPAHWASHVPAYSEITYKDLYPGVNLRLYSSNGYMKYDIIAEKGADISRIRLKYSGIDSIHSAYNSLYISTSVNRIIENAPYAYQVSGKDTLDVPCRFNLHEDEIRFNLPSGYDKKKELVIDPLLVFSTYSGSTMDNWGNTATFDEHGNVYSGGTVWNRYGGSLPVTKGAFQTSFGGVWDVALLKFDSTGQNLLYGTYLGGDSTETPLSLIVNHEDQLVILGITGSPDFPIAGNAFSNHFSGGDSVTNAIGIYNGTRFQGVSYRGGSDFFIATLSTDGGTLVSSTYLGGTKKEGINNAPGMPLSRNYGDEFRGEVNVDRNDNVYIISNTSSDDFPIVNGFQKTFGGGSHDAVIAKLSPDLSTLLWSTFLGGDQMDAGYSIKIVDDDHVVVAGGTESYDFPVTSGAYHKEFGGDVDGFVAILSDHGDSLQASTYVGTTEYDQVYFTDIDPDDNIYVYGQTSGNFPVSDSLYTNPNSGQFIQKFNKNLSQSLLSTVIGSGGSPGNVTPDISPTAFLVNECGNIFLSGWGGRINHYAGKYVGGYTFGMPVTDNAFQKSTDGSDFYLMVLAKDAKSLLYATFLGAFTSGEGEHVDGGTSRFDKRGIVYHAICACRDNSQFPTTPGVWSNTNKSPNGCNNGVFKFDLASLKAAFTTNSTQFDNPGVTHGCYPFDVVFLNKSIGGKLFQWDFGDQSGLRVQHDSVYHEYKSAGSYTVRLYALDENTCQKIDIATGRINVFQPHFIVPPDTIICQGERISLTAGGASLYEWTPTFGLNNSSLAAPLASPDSSVNYFLKMTDVNSCVKEDTVAVTVIPSVRIDIQSKLLYDCKDPTGIELINHTKNADRYQWDFGDGNFSTDSSVVYQYADSGSYTISLHAYGGTTCSDSAKFFIHSGKVFIPNVITPNQDLQNDRFRIISDKPVALKVLNRWGEPVFKSEQYLNDWNANGLPGGVYYYEITLDKDVKCNGWVEVLK